MIDKDPKKEKVSKQQKQPKAESKQEQYKPLKAISKVEDEFVPNENDYDQFGMEDDRDQYEDKMNKRN